MDFKSHRTHKAQWEVQNFKAKVLTKIKTNWPN